MRSNLPRVLVVVPCFNEDECVEVFFRVLQCCIKKINNAAFDVMFVNDGSTDGTGELLRKLSLAHHNVYYREFAQNTGHQSALRAGIDAASRYEAVIMMDSDLQHPPELIPEMVKAWRDGYKIVQMVRDDTQRNDVGLAKTLVSNLYYRLINKLSDLNLESGASDFRLIDSSIVKLVARSRENNLFLRGYFSWLRVSRKVIVYSPNERFAGSSKYNFHKMLRLAYSGVLQFSEKPLRFSVVLGAIVALLSFAYGIFLIIRYMVGGYAVSGWTSLMVLMLMCFGVNFMLIGVIGSYLAHSIVILKERPEYLVSDEKLPN